MEKRIQSLRPVEIQPLEDKKHVNLLSLLPGRSNMVQVSLNGHFDTVPPSLNVQTPNILNGKLYRGVVDMKGAVAGMSLALIAICHAALPLNPRGDACRCRLRRDRRNWDEGSSRYRLPTNYSVRGERIEIIIDDVSVIAETSGCRECSSST